ncbi:MAG: hypothetical protein V4598_04755 [Bdellovibrionota bacterium]
MNRSPLVLYGFTFLLAFCSLFYELIYAQILSVCIGGTKTQYLTIIALFTFALGMGTIAFGRTKLRYGIRPTFFLIECLLTILGGLGPFLITWILQPGNSPALMPFKIYLSYFIVFTIGFLSGFEIPCLFSLAGEGKGKILGMDYLGMLAASILFPLFFLPQLGTAPGALVIAACNGYALIWLRSDKPNTAVTIFLFSVVTILIAVILGNIGELNGVLSQLYLQGIP